VRDIYLPNQNLSEVGAWNIDADLKLGFGLSYGLSLESSKGEGTTVFLRVPTNMATNQRTGNPGTL
jgi:sensor histidine kinase YesM